MAEIQITKDNFEEEVLNSSLPVLVDFWAAWCGPCKMLSPIVAEIAEEEKARVKVGKINIDEEMDLAMQYGVQSIPTVLIFNQGEVVERSVGYVPKEELLSLIP